MQITGSYSFNAPPAAVWNLLMDTETIAACIPGCKQLRPLGDDRYAADVTVGVAAITATYSATVSIADKTPPSSYRLLVEATGRPGFVRGNAQVSLAAADSGTTVTVNATADAGGMIARVGQRMLESVARMTMDRFFACLASKVTGQ
jgi:carbon monoxide dehydrogenase subunit G